VQRLAGAIYLQLVEFEEDKYCSAAAQNVEEAQKLVEAWFEYVCGHDGTCFSEKENEHAGQVGLLLSLLILLRSQ
jgi:hypothetical protein